MKSFVAKLKRAAEHVNEFQEASGAWLDAKPYDFVEEPDPNPPKHAGLAACKCRRYRFCRVDQVPERLGLVLGDGLNNMRSALDHLALELARSNTHSMTDSEITGSEFPIFGPRVMTAGEETRKIGCIAVPARDAIKALQPYHRGNDYTLDPLWWLQELNRIDKHRDLTVFSHTLGMEMGAKFNVSPHGGPIYLSSIVTQIQPDTIFMQYGYPDCVPDDEMNVEPDLSPQIVFGKTLVCSGKPVIPTVRAIFNHVKDSVIAPIAKLL